MSLHRHSNEQASSNDNRDWRIGIVLAAFVLIAGALLFTEHQAHVLGVLVWLPLLACSLMHLFMHGHGGHEHGGSRTSQGGAS